VLSSDNHQDRSMRASRDGSTQELGDVLRKDRLTESRQSRQSQISGAQNMAGNANKKISYKKNNMERLSRQSQVQQKLVEQSAHSEMERSRGMMKQRSFV